MVVVVGGLVVVVGGLVGWLVVVTSAEPAVGTVVVVGDVLVVVVPDTAGPGVPARAVVGTGDGTGTLAAAEAPGCSAATVTQMDAVAPPAMTITVLVMRLIRACTRARAIGELAPLPLVIADPKMGARAHERGQTQGPRCATAYGPNLKT